MDYMLLHSQCLEHRIFRALVEDQIEASDKLRRHSTKISRRSDRQQDLFRTAVQTDLKRVGQLVYLDDTACNADLHP